MRLEPGRHPVRPLVHPERPLSGFIPWGAQIRMQGAIDGVVRRSKMAIGIADKVDFDP